MTTINRRQLLQLFGSAPLAAGFTWTDAEAAQAATQAQAARAGTGKTAYKPKFFTAHEWATLHVLVDLIIPKDDRSGAATDAGVPEFMDFMMTDQPNRQTAMRGGLAWIDHLCEQRFDKRFLDCSADQRTSVLDDIAWPREFTSEYGDATVILASRKPEFAPGVAFFNSLRDLTAAGFWSSKMGVEDLQYIGNTMVPEWKGCPPEALKKLGL